MSHSANQLTTVPSSGTVSFFFKCSRLPFDDLRVRRAFALATDRIALVNSTRPGQVSPALGGYVPAGIPGHVPGIATPYAPDRARALLKDAGFPGGRGFPATKALAQKHQNMVASFLQEQWKEELGVDISFELLEFGDILDRLNNDTPDVWIMGWSPDYPDPDNFLRVAINFHRISWIHDRYLQLVEEARGLTDQGQRMALYHQAEMILVEEIPLIPLLYGRYMYLRKPWVTRLPVSASMGILAKEIVLEPH